MNKKVLIGVGVGVCLAAIALSLGLYFGLREQDQGQVFNDGSQRTPLDDYVYSQDSLDQFSWFHASEYDFNRTSMITNGSYSAFVINMTSGYWLSGN